MPMTFAATNETYVSILAEVRALRAEVARLSAALAGTPTGAPVTPAAASPVVRESIPTGSPVKSRVACEGTPEKPHERKVFSVTADATKGILFHRTWCKGADLAATEAA